MVRRSSLPAPGTSMYSARLVTASKFRSSAGSGPSFSSTIAVASESRSHELRAMPRTTTAERKRTSLAAHEWDRNARDGFRRFAVLLAKALALGASLCQHLRRRQRPGLAPELGGGFCERAAGVAGGRSAAGILT